MKQKAIKTALDIIEQHEKSLALEKSQKKAQLKEDLEMIDSQFEKKNKPKMPMGKEWNENSFGSG